MHTGDFHRMGYLMQHHLAGATIQIANFVNFTEGKKYLAIMGSPIGDFLEL